ncbi:hypothetical protein EJP82_17640 [Paenibacillus anaericanus]|uniref:Lipocalin-like domain-containing protein n=1 Tax=Paenibacillus anaericanus TaxID=170367 RepID=A0A3S1BPI9_9BACL|nr:hypothetical protein [Paenibacillus anaericanus]RUT44441.1 hypothetical protein EJP82_17640 [Paenibacillus anaericanus]
MHKSLMLTMLLALSLLLMSCSKDNATQLLGIWEADQVSQKVGSKELISQYNHWEITEENIILKSFNFEIQGDTTIQKFSEQTRTLKYTWESNKQLQIDNQTFNIKLKKNEMNLINENIVIHFNRQK